jgi:hypothetical protein
MDDNDFEVETEGHSVEFAPPLNRSAVASLLASLCRDIATAFFDFFDVLFEVTAAHSNYEQEQQASKSAAADLEKLLGGNDG